MLPAMATIVRPTSRAAARQHPCTSRPVLAHDGPMRAKLDQVRPEAKNVLPMVGQAGPTWPDLAQTRNEYLHAWPSLGHGGPNQVSSVQPKISAGSTRPNAGHPDPGACPAAAAWANAAQFGSFPADPAPA